MEDSSVSCKRQLRDERKDLPPGQDKNIGECDRKRIINALAQREWRQRLKSDPEKYRQFREADNERVKTIRKTLSDEKRAQYNEKTRQRMAKYRQRRKQNGTKDNRKSVTRATSEKQRKQWREEKRLQREKMTSQKKRRINEKRRQRYAEKKEKKQKKDDKKAMKNSDTFPSDGARRQAVHRTIKILPKDPKKFVEVVSNIIQKTTPNKKAALNEKCIISPQSKKRLDFYDSNACSSKEKLKEIKQKRSKRDNQLRYLIHQAAMIKSKQIKASTARELGLSRKIIAKISTTDVRDIKRKKRKDALSETELGKVTNFFHQTDVSREMPNPRQVNKNMEPRRTLDGSLINSYEKFQKQNPETKVSYSKFVKCRPSNVKPAAQTKYNQCLCEYCTNVDLKISSLVRFCTAHHFEPICRDRYEASRLTLCPKVDGYYKKDCIDRKCGACGVANIETSDKAIELIRQHGLSDITWQSWAQEVVTKTVKGKQVTKRQMTQSRHTTTVQDLLEELQNSLQAFSKHLFNAQWQAEQFQHLKVNIPEKWVLLCSDFGENYICRQQDEAQSAHWSYDQVTLHPIVAYYHCQECGEPMHESFCFISDDHKHDQHAVHHYTTLVNQQLLSRGLSIEVEIQFSDGSPTQYKSKINFADMTMCHTDVGFHVEKHFFGSRHGKGPCDGEVGVLKRCITTGVKTRKTIVHNALEFFEYAKDKLSLPTGTAGDQHIHKKRTFIYVKDGDIKRTERKDRLANLKAVKDTRMTHCFRPVAPYVITSRERSCFCDVCLHPESTPTGTCTNEKLTGRWTVQTIRVNRRVQQDNMEIDDAIEVAPLNDVADDDGAPLQPADDDRAPLQPADDDRAPLQPADDDRAPLQPADEGAPLQPADDGGDPLQPADDDGAPLQPPDDGGAPLQPPDDGGAPLQPPDDGGAPLQLDGSAALQLAPLQPADIGGAPLKIDGGTPLQPYANGHVSSLQLLPFDCSLDVVSNSFSDEECLAMDTSGLSGILDNILEDDEMQLSPIIAEIITGMGQNSPTHAEKRSYDSGQYIKIAHGKKIYPAVVDRWPYVQFFGKKGKGWTPNEINHTVVFDDVIGPLSTPDIIMAGSRILYKFNDPDL